MRDKRRGRARKGAEGRGDKAKWRASSTAYLENVGEPVPSGVVGTRPYDDDHSALVVHLPQGQEDSARRSRGPLVSVEGSRIVGSRHLPVIRVIAGRVARLTRGPASPVSPGGRDPGW
jgi:hypothetical protein